METDLGKRDAERTEEEMKDILKAVEEREKEKSWEM